MAARTRRRGRRALRQRGDRRIRFALQVLPAADLQCHAHDACQVRSIQCREFATRIGFFWGIGGNGHVKEQLRRGVECELFTNRMQLPSPSASSCRSPTIVLSPNDLRQSFHPQLVRMDHPCAERVPLPARWQVRGAGPVRAPARDASGRAGWAPGVSPARRRVWANRSSAAPPRLRDGQKEAWLRRAGGINVAVPARAPKRRQPGR